MTQEMTEEGFFKLLADFQVADNECKTSDFPNLDASASRAEQLRQELSAAPFVINNQGEVELKHKHKPAGMGM